MNNARNANAYRTTHLDGATEASPTRKVTMLLDGTLERVRRARAHLIDNDIPAKASALSSAVSVIEALRLSLDEDAGGEIAERLGALYDYMTLRLTEANAMNDAGRLDEVIRLLDSIASAWREGPDRMDAQKAVAGL